MQEKNVSKSDNNRTTEEKPRANFICSRSTLDGIYPPLILAIQASRLGAEATIFFTFDGINAIRKGGLAKAKYYPPGWMGAIPGIGNLAGKKMIELAEQRANVPAPADLLEMAMLEGVKLYACQMTMEMMGLKQDDLVPGVEVTNAENYMRQALTAQINMFI